MYPAKREEMPLMDLYCVCVRVRECVCVADKSGEFNINLINAFSVIVFLIGCHSDERQDKAKRMPSQLPGLFPLGFSFLFVPQKRPRDVWTTWHDWFNLTALYVSVNVCVFLWGCLPPPPSNAWSLIHFQTDFKYIVSSVDESWLITSLIVSVSKHTNTVVYKWHVVCPPADVSLECKMISLYFVVGFFVRKKRRSNSVGETRRSPPSLTERRK